MKAKRAGRGIYSVIDPKSPWKLPSSYAGFPKYPGEMSDAEWKMLLAKAKQGDAEAEYNVAAHYSDGCRDRRGGILVRVSYRKAAQWYRRSAEHGNLSAKSTLGVILGGNYGVGKDVREALLWLKRAFRAGDTSCAPTNIAVTYRENGHFRLAVRWFRKAAALGDDAVLIQLGIHSYWGKGVRAGYAEAVSLFRKAIHGKNISECDRDDANFYLAIAYLEGKGTAKSLPIARKHLERANRDNDHVAAQLLLKQMARLG